MLFCGRAFSRAELQGACLTECLGDAQALLMFSPSVQRTLLPSSSAQARAHGVFKIAGSRPRPHVMYSAHLL